MKMKLSRWVMTALALAAFAAEAEAATPNWIGGDGTWDNANTAGWSGGAVPVNNDTVTISTSAVSGVTVTYNASNLSGNGLASLTVANAAGGVNTLNIAAGDVLPTATFTLSAGGKVVQSDGIMIASTTGNSTFNGGTLELSGGTNQSQNNINFSAGRIQQSGGVFKTVNFDFTLKTASAGASATFDHSGGTNSIRMFYVGDASTAGTNTYNLSGSGVVIVTYDVGIGNSVGPSSFTQSGGRFLPSRSVYIRSNSTTALQGGYFGAPSLYMSGGVFTQTAGVGNVSSDFVLSGGELNLHGGIFTSRLVTVTGTAASDATLSVTGRTMTLRTTIGTSEVTLGGGAGRGTINVDDTLWAGAGGNIAILTNGTFNVRGGAVVTNFGYLSMQGGTFNQSSGSVFFSQDREIGTLAGASATGIVANGYLPGRYLELGCANGGLNLGGAGTLIHTGGILRITDSANSALPGIIISHTNATQPSIWILKGGVVTNDSANLNVHALGTLQGYGALPLGVFRLFRNSGRIVADGDGVDRTLDLSSYGGPANTGAGAVTNPVDNTSDKGWFAIQRGKLLLPSFPVSAGVGAYNWGESTNDTSIDLVNSARLEFTGLSGAGTRTFSGALLGTNRNDVAAPMPGGRYALSIHDFALSGSSPTFTSYTVTVRYDHTAVPVLSGGENSVKVWHYTGGDWVDVTATRDTVNRLVTSTSRASAAGLGQFAVTVDPPPPPPGTVITVR